MPVLQTVLFVIFFFVYNAGLKSQVLNHNTLAKKYYHKDAQWYHDSGLMGNTVNTIAFDKVIANKIRINFRHSKLQVTVTEIECY